MMDKETFVEKEVEKHNQEVYQGEMPAHNRSVARSMFGREYDFWEREAVREDNHNSRG